MTKQGARLKRRLFWSATLSIAVVVIVAVAGISVGTAEDEGLIREQVLELNNVREDLKDDPATTAEAAREKADVALVASQSALREAAAAEDDTTLLAIGTIAVVAIAVICAMVLYLYRSVARPFMKLEDFAEEVAAGNLDAPLRFGRANPFGKFTWAFDHLRQELKRSRKAEEQASESHKTTLASLSHDLRTPLASLRAYAEALDMGLATTDEERAEYEHAIMRKCDEASSLVEDLFQHALANMGRIQVECAPVQAAFVLESCVSAYAGIAPLSRVSLDSALVEADEARLGQVVGNLIGNSLKYARGATIEIEGVAQGDVYTVAVRDLGPGIPADDLPFATERFYRGSNAADEAGSGLGLFITSYLIERMGGRLRLENAHPGLRATIELRIIG